MRSTLTSAPQRTLLVTAAALSTALALTACSGTEPASTASSASGTTAAKRYDKSAAALLPAGTTTIHVASGPGYPPFLDVASDGTTLSGAAPEEMRLIGEVLGVKIVFDDIKFDAVFPALQAGKTDAATMALGITPDRLKSVDFVSDYRGGTSLLVAAGNPKKISLDAMCGQKVAALQGSVYTEKYLPAFDKACTSAGKAAIAISTFKTSADAVLALTSGRVDATMADLAPAVYQAKQSNGVMEALDVNYDPSTWGIAVPKGSKLEKALQAALNSLIKSGAYLENLKRFDVQAGAIGSSEIYTTADQLSE